MPMYYKQYVAQKVTFKQGKCIQRFFDKFTYLDLLRWFYIYVIKETHYSIG